MPTIAAADGADIGWRMARSARLPRCYGAPPHSVGAKHHLPLSPSQERSTEMTTISSSTLFHFTRSHESLLSILRHTFWPNYCLETMPFEDDHGEPRNGTPMVCFCDIPLASTSEHMGKYGRYAIGMGKKWGIANGIAPVLYTHDASPISRGIRELMDQGLRIGKGPVNNALWDEVYRIMAFTKPYEGHVNRAGVRSKVRFNDEREWRWVPQDFPDGVQRAIDSSQFVDGRPPKDESEALHKGCQLHFGPSDIRYIIVQKEDEILPTVRDILAIKESFSQEEKTLLTTRVLSSEQIREDF